MSSNAQKGSVLIHIALIVLAGIVYWLPTGATCGELLPFPSMKQMVAPVQQRSAREPPYLLEYRSKVKALDCRDLKSLRDGLLDKIKGADRKDTRYFLSLIRVVEDVRDKKRCP